MWSDKHIWYQRGEVIYVHHLHTNPRLIRHDARADGAGRSWCRVEGKARPMLILRRCRRLIVDTARSTGELSGTNQCVWYRVETRVGYWVLSLSSSAPPGPHRCYPSLVQRGKDSYVDFEPLCYPAESVCQRPNEQVYTVDERVLGLIEKEIGMRALGCPDYRA